MRDYQFQVRAIKEHEYEQVLSWFSKDRGWFMQPEKRVLPRGTSFVIEDGANLLACAFLYISNSPIGFLEFTATNPQVSPIRAFSALTELVRQIQNKAAQYGCTSFIQFINNDRLRNFYQKKLGFKEAEKASLMVWTKDTGG